ncbi:hypothetical protein [Streptomyces sp. DT117]|uniref:hypothetical protein n=1 Tax=Streptomyces sp. DT117 TaxID=3393422 RepID=UPI003CF19E4A
MSGGPNDAEDHLADMGFVLCELSAHDTDTDHAARLWTAEAQPPRGLWFMWTRISDHMVLHRFVTLTLCPYWKVGEEDSRDWCNFYEDHPDLHQFHVRDPLRDLLHKRTRLEAEQRFFEKDPAEGDGDES